MAKLRSSNLVHHFLALRSLVRERGTNSRFRLQNQCCCCVRRACDSSPMLPRYAGLYSVKFLQLFLDYFAIFEISLAVLLEPNHINHYTNFKI